MFFRGKNGDKKLTKVQKRQITEKMLIEEFPLVPVILASVLNILLGLGAIGFQIASIVLETDLFFIATG